MESIRCFFFRGSIKPRYEVYDDLNWIVTSPVHPGGLGCFSGMKNCPVVDRLFFISHEIRIPISQPKYQ